MSLILSIFIANLTNIDNIKNLYCWYRYIPTVNIVSKIVVPDTWYTMYYQPYIIGFVLTIYAILPAWQIYKDLGDIPCIISLILPISLMLPTWQIYRDQHKRIRNPKSPLNWYIHQTSNLTRDCIYISIYKKNHFASLSINKREEEQQEEISSKNYWRVVSLLQVNYHSLLLLLYVEMVMNEMYS